MEEKCTVVCTDLVDTSYRTTGVLYGNSSGMVACPADSLRLRGMESKGFSSPVRDSLYHNVDAFICISTIRSAIMD